MLAKLWGDGLIVFPISSHAAGDLDSMTQDKSSSKCFLLKRLSAVEVKKNFNYFIVVQVQLSAFTPHPTPAIFKHL